MLIYIAIGFAAACFLAWAKVRYLSFVAQVPDDYAFGEELNIRDKLNGAMVCEGIIYGPTGRVTSRFVADWQGVWDGNKGTIAEHFRYDSGAEEHRKWSLEIQEDGKIVMQADDVIGNGYGRQAGDGVLTQYKLKLSPQAGGHVLRGQDWLYLLPNGHIMNRSQFRKWGVKVAELVAVIRPRTAEDER